MVEISKKLSKNAKLAKRLVKECLENIKKSSETVELVKNYNRTKPIFKPKKYYYEKFS